MVVRRKVAAFEEVWVPEKSASGRSAGNPDKLTMTVTFVDEHNAQLEQVEFNIYLALRILQLLAYIQDTLSSSSTLQPGGFGIPPATKCQSSVMREPFTLQGGTLAQGAFH